MERISLKKVELEGTKIDHLYLFLDDEGSIIFLPMLWTVHLACKSTVHKWRVVGSFDQSAPRSNSRKAREVTKVLNEELIAENTVENYVGHMFKFLKYINKLHKSLKTPSVHNTELVNTRFVNEYLNEVLPNELQSSASLKAHQAAISAYYLFLFSLEIREPIVPTVNPKTNQSMAEKDMRPQKINYVSREERRTLLNACGCNRDKLILRMGFEVGLRTEENTGLILGKHKANRKQNNGLLALFDELETNPDKWSFEFILNGKFTKGGKTRRIYFDRDLLEAMKHYCENERENIMKVSGRECETMFVRNDNEGKGLAISAVHASNVFHDLLVQFPNMNQSLSYHDLRHTFATELYHELAYDEFRHEKGSQNNALLNVSMRLGHSYTTSTMRYLRTEMQMKVIEGMN
jgi:site-specific recombinase XerD